MSENEALPEPLTPADCDLSSMKWFPLRHKRLLKSSWWKRASRDARAISVVFWAVAYDEIPAASLPNDDFELAAYAGFGENVAGWLVFKAAVMSAWLLCSDGRWYHPTLAEVARETWEATEKSREREREKKRRQRARGETKGQDAMSPGDEAPAPPVTPPKVPRGKRHTEQDITGEEKRESESHPVDSVGPPETVKPAKAPAAPKVPKATKKAARDARASRIVWDWTPDEIDTAHAAGKGFDPLSIKAMGDKFFNYHKAKGTLMVDWRAAWRTWVGNQIEFNGGPQGGNRTSASNSRPADDRRVAQRQDRVGAMLAGAMGALDDVRR